MLACCAEGPGFELRMGSPRIFKIEQTIYTVLTYIYRPTQQQKLSSLWIACNIRLVGALYSAFCAEASACPWTSPNKVGMYQTPSLTILSLHLTLAAGHINRLNLRSVSLRQYKTQLKSTTIFIR